MTEVKDTEGAGAGRPPRPHLPEVVVICLGNTLMADDGVGAAVAREIAVDPLAEDPRVGLVVSPQADGKLVRHFLESRALIVVDAIDAGADPGAIFRFGPDEAGVTSMRSHNIHGMGLAYLVTNARLLGKDPEVVIVTVQVGDVRPRPDELSPAVADAVGAAAALVASEAQRLLSEQDAVPA